jgi:cobalamin biosynthesis protein CbiG
MIVAGIGCRRGCPADDIVALVRQAETISGRHVDLLATPGFKQHEAGLHEAAAMLGIGLSFVGEAALAAVQQRCPTRSAAALRHVGVASVAEGAALAASGGALVLARIANADATCALAGA